MSSTFFTLMLCSDGPGGNYPGNLTLCRCDRLMLPLDSLVSLLMVYHTADHEGYEYGIHQQEHYAINSGDFFRAGANKQKQSHLCTVFKRYMGITVDDYRNIIRKK